MTELPLKDWPATEEFFQTEGLCHRAYRLENPPDAITTIPLPRELEEAVDKRKLEYRFGRAVAGQLCYELTGTFAYPSYRPRRAPLWPEGVVGSISHTRNRISVVMGKAEHFQSIGHDVERLLTVKRYETIKAHILTKEELGHQEACSAQFGTLVFSVKEALFKALHPLCQQFFGFQDAAVLRCEGGEGVLVLKKSLGPSLAKGSFWPFHYVITGECVFSLVIVKRPLGP